MLLKIIPPPNNGIGCRNFSLRVQQQQPSPTSLLLRKHETIFQQKNNLLLFSNRQQRIKSPISSLWISYSILTTTTNNNNTKFPSLLFPQNSNSNYQKNYLSTNTDNNKNNINFSKQIFQALPLISFSRDEFDRAFSYLDTDGDGKLTFKELEACFGKELATEFIVKFGSDINREEFVQQLSDLAQRVDSRANTVALSMFLTGTAVGLAVPALPQFVANMDASSSAFGLVVGALGLSRALGNIPFAILADSVGRKPLLVGGTCLVSISFASLYFASSMEHLLISRLITGAGVSAFTCGSTLLLADISTPLNRARTMAPILAAFSAGTAVGPAIGGILVDYMGIQNCFALTGAIFTGLALFNQFIVTETGGISSTGSTTNQHSLGQAAAQAVKSWRPLLRDRHVRAIVLLNGAYFFCIGGGQLVLLPLMLTRDGFTPTEIGFIFGAMSGVFVVGSQPAGFLADRFGKPKIIALSMLTTGIGIAMFPEPKLAIVSLALWSLGGTLLGTAPTAYVADLANSLQRSQALALLRTMGDVGFLLGAALTGMFADSFTVDLALRGNAALMVTGAGAFWLVVRNSHR
jgi:MFS family permease/Ca2+-binding EF-hand superfamily protein